jgi:hypothetical protein
LCAVGAFFAVLQTFLIGKHYIIPTILLVIVVLFGNLSWYGLQQARWANYVNFWIGFIVTAHLFFAIFWAKTPRAILGDAFEPVAIVLALVMLVLTWCYASKNALFN